MMKIIKSGGYCSDGSGWNQCSFWTTTAVETEVLEGQTVISGYKHSCKLFNLELGHEGSAVCCNKIYGIHYEGRP